ncbi:MAG: methylmalonyl-CoA epimerase [Dactylosporangium sp.]|nr:methylmalonyl-CoA epimerase [Dactylosporangium sp.]NNJ61942.1 methylmalonyl-CoA epimerase [Dactylosporangium sp.]
MAQRPHPDVSPPPGVPPAAPPTAGVATTPDPAGAGLLRIDHVGIAVADLDQAIEFHQTLFGMCCEQVEEHPGEGVREATMRVGPDPAASRVQLLAPLSPSSAVARFLDRSGPGLQHVAYTVADLDATCSALRDRGIRLLYRAAVTGTAGSRVNFVHPRDAGGALVELVEPAEAG